MPARDPRIHLSLRVQPTRLDALVAFYATLFGVPPRKRHADYVQFDLADPPLNLTFVPTTRAATGELDHLGLQVFSEQALAAARERLAAAGLPLRDEPQVDCCYARQSKFWLTDPEGREVEVFLKLADLERHVSEPASACCTPQPAPSSGCCADATASGAACCATDAGAPR